MYNLQLAREHQSLIITACTPGFIKVLLLFVPRRESSPSHGVYATMRALQRPLLSEAALRTPLCVSPSVMCGARLKHLEI